MGGVKFGGILKSVTPQREFSPKVLLSTRSIGQRRTVRRHGPQKPKRTAMEIYHDILIGIERESKTRGIVKRTRVQQHSNLSYDKFSRHLNDMAVKGLVILSPLAITEKGREFVREYDRIRLFMRDMGARFFETETPVRRIALQLAEDIPNMSHAVLLYEDREYADLVAAEYLSRGLEKGESCIYLASEDPAFAEKRLIKFGGIVREGLRDHRLRIYPGHMIIRRGTLSPDAMKRFVKDSTRGMEPPYRVFGNIGRLPALPKGIQSRLLREELLHEIFGSVGITMLCWHNLARLPRGARRGFVESIVKQHHYVVFASDPSRAFGFDTSLLRTET